MGISSSQLLYTCLIQGKVEVGDTHQEPVSAYMDGIWTWEGTRAVPEKNREQDGAQNLWVFSCIWVEKMSVQHWHLRNYG